MRILDEAAIEAIAIGAAILGTGGGGNPYIGRLRCQQELKRGRQVRVVTLDELADDEPLLKVDICNAYNSISRNACMEGV